ncbi:unnamed protein product [Euphydryas editha]|uniref:Transposase n=1 Tax=Euphydryas editha TaxID=104508 RepID=A0AAU9TJA5_EUPED|nr:unnamed protein product [Euphydryas editha]
MLPQPPYSPGLAPCGFFLFPKLKRSMKGGSSLIEEIKTASKEDLNKITKNTFFKCFEHWIGLLEMILETLEKDTLTRLMMQIDWPGSVWGHIRSVRGDGHRRSPDDAQIPLDL